MGLPLSLFRSGRRSFYLKPTREIQLLSAFETTEPLSGRMGDPLRLAYASYFSELAEAALVEGEPNPRLFEMICAAFRTLSETEKGAVLQTLARAVELKLLAMTGHRPQLDRCVLCGAEPAGAQRVAISPLPGRRDLRQPPRQSIGKNDRP
ncbi:MAG: hypothetical protein KatS3mg115_0279 [Candidatus Poribacteria bacterium]|nr:MAG: hypothetical protein KatS3mg115_0279 [Candidatus Poribacteria bacterium]